jgi:hypothetical protein
MKYLINLFHIVKDSVRLSINIGFISVDVTDTLAEYSWFLISKGSIKSFFYLHYYLLVYYWLKLHLAFAHIFLIFLRYDL